MRSFIKSLQCAALGIRACFAERNFRFHIALGVYMFAYLLIYDWFKLTRGEWAAIVLASALVLAAEAGNTALEALVDLVIQQKNNLAGRVKDIAAGAVLLSALGAVGVGIAVLWQPAAFRAMFRYYQNNPAMLAVLILSLIATGWFVWHKKSGAKEGKERRGH
ncbi:MAG: diacylglycerol kinase family protein [Oscillospiraceae bacterium]|jgi:diacylglycerol kinase (ATP)|nr:diacylglycerol kinase family protein [Oscillospiraceae bacterium]